MLTESQSTAIELLGQNPATKMLKELGFTNEQLLQLRFHPKDQLRPITQRPIHLPAALLGRWKLHQKDCPPVLSLMRDYLICKHALIDGPAENSPYVAEAWQHVAEFLSASHVDARLRYLGHQRERARKSRGRIPEIGTTIREFVIEYSRKPDNRSLKPREMWPGFGSHMRFHRLDPKLAGNAYEYAIDKSIAFGTFCNYIRGARKEEKQQRG